MSPENRGKLTYFLVKGIQIEHENNKIVSKY